MKKIFITLLIAFFFYFFISTLNVDAAQNANANYLTFVEIMMPEGKLLLNFTQNEKTSLLESVLEKPKMIGVNTNFYSKNINATYISDTVFSQSNLSNSDITYQLSTKVALEVKSEISASGSFAKSVGVSIKMVKAEVSDKLGVNFDTSIKINKEEKEDMKLIVEAHSKCLVYLTGDIQISNGAASAYIMYLCVGYGLFEVATIKNQYMRIEKVEA